MPVPYSSLFERLLANSVESELYEYAGTPCWEWTGRIANCYGRLCQRIDGKLRTRLAHRVMAELVAGRPLDPHLETVEHLCELPWCVNFLHFSLVTRANNTADAMARKFGRPRKVFKPLVDLDLYVVDRFVRSLPVLKTELMDTACPF